MRERMQRFDKYMQTKGLNDNQVTSQCNLSQGLLGQARTGKSDLGTKTIDKLLIKYQDLSRVWLLTGEGEMLLPSQSNREAITIESGGDKIEMPVLGKDYRMVPIIHIDSVGGIHSSNDIIEEPEYIEGYVPFTGARDGDLVIYESGDSMAPTIPAGSLMLVRRVDGWRDYLGYGNIFVLVLRDGRRITKEVTRYDDNPREYVWCVSHNDAVPNEELPKAYIVEVWKVIKWVTNKGW